MSRWVYQNPAFFFLANKKEPFKRKMENSSIKQHLFYEIKFLSCLLMHGHQYRLIPSLFWS